MNINNQTISLMSKNLRMRNSEQQAEEKALALRNDSTVTNPEDVMNAMELMGKNNIAFQGAVQNLPKKLAPKAGMVAALLAMGSLTSCDKMCLTPECLGSHNDYSQNNTYVFEGDETIINLYLNINIEVNSSSSDAEILAEIRRLRELFEQYIEDEAQRDAAIIQALLANGVTLQQILNQTTLNGEALNILITTLEQSLPQISAYINKLVSLIEAGTQLEEEDNQLLQLIFQALQAQGQAQAEFNQNHLMLIGQMLTKLDAITGRLETNDQNQAARDEELQSIIQSILNNISDINNQQNQIISLLLNLEGSFVDIEALNSYIQQVLAQQVLTNQQLSQMINNDTIRENQLNQLISLIVINNAITQSTNDAVRSLQASLNDYGDSILNEMIQNRTDINIIREALNVIISQNAQQLASTENIASILGTGIVAILNSIDNLNANQERRFLQILAKIPNECNCEANLTAIIQRLINIIDLLQEGNNEGVDDELSDLEEYFNNN